MKVKELERWLPLLTPSPAQYGKGLGEEAALNLFSNSHQQIPTTEMSKYALPQQMPRELAGDHRQEDDALSAPDRAFIQLDDGQQLAGITGSLHQAAIHAIDR